MSRIASKQPPQIANKKTKVNFKKVFKNLAVYCKKYLIFIILAVIFAVGGAVLNLLGPEYIQQIVDEIATSLFAGTNINLNTVWDIAIILIIFYLTGAILNLINGLMMTRVTQRVTKTMRKDISKKINRLPLKYIDSHSYGDILSRVTNDVDTIGQTLSNSITTLVTSISLLVGSIIMMFVTNWIMALTAIFATLIGFGLMTTILKKSQKYFIMQQKSLGKLNGHIEEIYSGHDVVKAYNGEKKAQKTFQKYNNELYTSGWKSQFLSGLMMPLMHFIGNFGYVAVCVVGAVLAMEGIISFGVISAFIIYVRLFTQPLSQLAQAFTSLQSTAAASERVFEMLNEKELADESNKNLKIEEIKGNVQFLNVKFGYNAKNLDFPTQNVIFKKYKLNSKKIDKKYNARFSYDPSKLVIKDFSIDIKAGQKVAIVGPTGAGKTTLVNLLMRFYETNSGTIKIDGIDTKELTREQVHNMFSMVLQDTWLFEGTIHENIVYDRTDTSREEVIKACKTAGVDHFIRTLPDGYDAKIDETTTISAGQKQLLTIARAMVQNSPMLILDEATSSVDTRTEIVIQQAMDKLTENRTSFIIAHRLSTIKNADIILVMQNGDIVESGNHETLMKKGKVYAELYNSQFEEN